MTDKDTGSPDPQPTDKRGKAAPEKPEAPPKPTEIGGPKGLEPTRYGDWERNGLATDF